MIESPLARRIRLGKPAQATREIRTERDSRGQLSDAYYVDGKRLPDMK